VLSCTITHFKTTVDTVYVFYKFILATIQDANAECAAGVAYVSSNY